MKAVFGRSAMVMVLVAGLAACGSPPAENAASDATSSEATAAGAASESVAAAGEKPGSFAQCAACHAVEPGRHGVGPSLAGVYGTRSGEIAGYAFSDAMKNAGLTWDDATLDRYLAAPMKVVPGTKMAFAGVADPAKRKELIEYLKTLK